MPDKRYLMTPGPTPVPPAGAAGDGGADRASPRRRLPQGVRRVRGAPEARSTARDDVLMFAASGTGRDGVGDHNLIARRRPDRRPLGRQLRRALGEDRRRLRLDVAHLKEEWGASPDPARLADELDANPATRRLPHALGDLDRRRRRRRGARRASRRSTARSSSSTRSRASAPSSSRPTHGASTRSSPARRRRSCARPASRRSPSRTRPTPQRRSPAARRATTSTGSRPARRSPTRRPRSRRRSR